jgi:hypothetical protein
VLAASPLGWARNCARSDSCDGDFAGLPSSRTRSDGALGCWAWEAVEPGRSPDDGTGAALFAEDGRPVGSGGVGISAQPQQRAVIARNGSSVAAREGKGRRTAPGAGSKASCLDDGGHPARAKKRVRKWTAQL